MPTTYCNAGLQSRLPALLFGSDAVVPFRELKEIQAEIVTAARVLAHGHVNTLLLPNLEAKIWTTSEEDDIRHRINHLITYVEAIYRPAFITRSCP